MNFFMLLFTIAALLLFPITQSLKEEFVNLEYSDKRGDCTCEVETYGPEIEHGYIKSPNYPNFDGCNGRCIYMILPHPNKSVSLYTAQFQISSRASLIVYSIVELDGDYLRIPHAKIRRSSSYYYSSEEQSFPGFVSAKNAGYEVHFMSHTEEYYTSFKISFDRNYEYDDICEFPFIELGLEEKIIQSPHPFRSASGCIYHLLTNHETMEEEDEMLITIEESDEGMVSIRTVDENGNINYEEPSGRARSVLTSAYHVEIMSHKSSRTNGLYKMPKITVKVIQKKCQCAPSEYQLDYKKLPTITIQSPGYPDLYCPKKECEHSIGLNNYQYIEDKIGILEIKLKASIGAKDSFSLGSDAKNYVEASSYKSGAVFLNQQFVIKQQPLKVKYMSYSEYIKRYFEVNVTQLLINAECACSFYKDKELSPDREGNIEISFPQYCNYIFCNFQFTGHSYYSSPRTAVEFRVENGINEDIVSIEDNKHLERYKGSLLDRFNRYEIVRNTEFTFYRENFNATKPTKLILNYTGIDNQRYCDSEGQTLYVDNDNPVIITSPGFPQNYQNEQNCHFLVTTCENCRIVLSIDEIDVENFHDFVKIYDGNSTDGVLLASYTAHVAHKVLNVSTATTYIVFQTDQSTTDRGFHITATAQSTLDDSEGDSYTRTYVLVGLGLLFIISIIGSIFVYEKYIKSWMRSRRQENAPLAQIE